jgi:tRNA G26 N,N-dimethylase Trm1
VSASSPLEGTEAHSSIRYVVANDLSASAVQDINRNIEYNGLLPTGLPEGYDPESKSLTKHQVIEATLGRVRANEGDAMYVPSRLFDRLYTDVGA